MTTHAQPAPVPPTDNSSDFTAHKDTAIAWFRSLRDQICATFEALEDGAAATQMGHLPPARFERTPWDRAEGGGGEMSLMRGGRLFEKVGVNISTVYGTFSPAFRAAIPGGAENDGAFWASGISLVSHMQSPHVPAIHMNTRMIVTDRGWFGGGIDLNPPLPDVHETMRFHDALKAVCDRHDPAYYPAHTAWCDSYFFLPHRNVTRGVGGIFYDYLNTKNWQADFAYTQDVGRNFIPIYTHAITAKMNAAWTEEERERQLCYRGLYAEYNLLYDRGTQFGLKTNGNVDAILMSLPPHAKWP
ncbi:MAG: oxygen-dependent coproporphyrinogen oxidase [Pseudomonadota bacterium]